MNRTLIMFVVVSTALLTARSAGAQSGQAGGAPAAPRAGTSNNKVAPGAAVQGSESSSAATAQPPGYEEHQKIWNSPEMVEAREWIEQRAKLSKRWGPKQAELYIARLKQMSPSQMTEWLKKFHAEQANTARSEDVARAARQAAIDNAAARRMIRAQQSYESYQNIAMGQTQAAVEMRERIMIQNQFAMPPGSMIGAPQTLQAHPFTSSSYSWVFPTPEKYRQWAMAAALPGDLPAGDTNNFLRGEAAPNPAVEAAIRLGPK